MVEGTCNLVMKTVIGGLNFLLFVICLAVVIVALTTNLVSDESWFDDLNPDTKDAFNNDYNIMRKAAWALAIVALVICVISFFGCVGACFEIAWMLYVNAAIVSLVLAVLLGMVILLVIARKNVSEKVADTVEHLRQKNNNDWAVIEKQLKCCGAKERCKDRELPTCYDRLERMIKSRITLVIALASISIVIMFVAITLSCALACAIQQEDRDIHHHRPRRYHRRSRPRYYY